jgi:dephospho-CoA kinase
MIIGLTGVYGSGKTTTAEFFKELGATIIDADEIGHKLLKKECKKEVIEAFGQEILTGKEIDRAKLAEIVFRDKDSLEKLNDITHPLIKERILEKIQKAKGITIIDVALIDELGLRQHIEKIIVVKSDNMQMKRLNTEATKLILQNQQSEETLLNKADYIIDNTGSLAETKEQVEELWKKLQ